MSSAGTLGRNIASNWVGYTVHVAVAFFLTPYVIHTLGAERYGIWTLIAGLTGYYGFLDMGVTSGLIQYLTRYLAIKDPENLNRTASTGFIALTCCGFIVFLISVVLGRYVSQIFQIPPDSSREAAVVVLITGASVAIQFYFTTYSVVFVVVQRFDLSNGIGIFTRLVSAVSTIVCLKLNYGLIGLSVVVAGTNILDYIIRWRVAAQLLPVQISPWLASREKLRELMTFGIPNMAISGGVRLISYTDTIVIAAFMPVAAVAPFAIAESLRTYFDEIFRRIGYVFFPAVTELDAQGDQQTLKRLYLVSSKFMFLGSIFCGATAILWARDFFRLWLGMEYAEPVGYPRVAELFYLLVFGSMVSVAQRIGYQVLLGSRRIRMLGALFAAEGIAHLFLSVLLVRSYGLTGVALGTLVPAVIFQGFLQPLVVCRFLQISLSEYCREVLLRPGLIVPPLLLLCWAFLSLQRPNSWIALFYLSLITWTGMIPFLFLVGFNKAERDLLLVRPVTKALRFLAAIGPNRSWWLGRLRRLWSFSKEFLRMG